MTIPRPTGEYKSQMTTPPQAWPEADEDMHGQRAGELLKTGLQLDKSVGSWLRAQTSIFDGNTWFGHASDAGKSKVDNATRLMQSTGELLASAIKFHRGISESITNAKQNIIAICDAAQKVIDSLLSRSLSSKEDQQKRVDAIKAIVAHALLANSAVVSAAGTAISAGLPYLLAPDKDVPDFAKDVPEFAGSAQGAMGGTPGPAAVPTDSNTTPTAAAPAKAGDDKATAVPTDGATTSAIAAPQTQVAGGTVAVPADQATTSSGATPQNLQNAGYSPRPPTPTPPSPSTPGLSGGSGGGGSSSSPSGGGASSGGSSGSPAQSTSSSSSGAKAGTPSDFQAKADAASDAKNAQAKGGASGGGTGAEKAPTEQFAKGVASAATQQPSMSPAAATSAPIAPIAPPTDAAASAPIQHTAGSTSGGGVGGSAGGGMGGGAGGGSFGSPATSAPTPPPMPLGPPATPPPAGAPPPGSATSQPAAAGNTGPGVNAASTSKTDPALAGMAPMPVSAARMERDAVLSASTAGAMQRHRGNANAALIQARRIAAALNMGAPQYGFYWVTGLAADGSIVVANSFGLAYIPDGVELPAQVTMASADESIPPAERGKWATYPILAIQGWAQAHDQTLRAVIATKEQFASFDPGVPKVVLQSDDIPETGKMKGRSRLEVIAPGVATRLASVGDGALDDLLPVAPADSTAPEDKSAALWFGLTKPLMSTSPDRGVTHLEAFVTYAEHAQELALHKAYNAFDAEVKRTAIADWVYWQHLSVLMSDAISADATV